MTIHLSSDHEHFVRSLVRSGQYSTEEQVIDEALRLLQERDEQGKLGALRQEIAIGIELAGWGELAPFDPRATLERVRSR